jgi:hypothetical protein
MVRVLVPTADAAEGRRILAAGPRLEDGVDLPDGADDTGGEDT